MAVREQVNQRNDQYTDSLKPYDLHAAMVKSHVDSVRQELVHFVHEQREARQVVDALRNVDLRPRVYILDDNTALVVAALFTKWGGFAYRQIRVTTPIEEQRLGPEHSIYKYNCGIDF